MDCYFLKIIITEFIYKSNEESEYNLYQWQKNQIKEENKEEQYEIQFELRKSNEKYVLKIINDEKGNKIPFSDYFTLITSININKNNKENIKYDYLEILLYSKNKEKEDYRKLIDIDQGKLIDENCINTNKTAELNLGKFFIKFIYKLLKLEDLYNLDEKEKEKDLNENNNILYKEIEPNIHKEVNSSGKSGTFRKINSKDFFDINVDIFEEDENEEEENSNSNSNIEKDKDKEKEEKNPFESAYKNKSKKNFTKIFRNTILSTYELIHLEQPILKDIVEDNLIECFLISGLSKSKKIINNSESYIPQCNHKNCQNNLSYSSEIFFRLQKSKSIFEEMDSNLITNLIFPSGIKICFEQNILKSNLIKQRNSLQFKKANYSFNVLTDLNGKRYYIYSIIFFIKFYLKEFFDFYNEYKDIKYLNTTEFFDVSNNNNIFIPFSFSIISKFFDINKFNIILKDLYISFNTNELNTEFFDNELIHLLYEIPTPPINSKFNIFLPNSRIEIYSNIYENKIYKNINVFNIFFEKYTYNIKFIIKIFILIILERKIIIYSSQNEKIYLTIEALLLLIYPLKWVNTYIPLIPDENINLILQSFLPFLIGMTQQMFLNYSKIINNLNSNTNNNNNTEDKINSNWDNIFIINLDSENISPNDILEEIINNTPVIEYIEDEFIKGKNKGELNNEKIKKIFLDEMIILIGDFEKFTSKLGENILFNQKIFLKNKSIKYEKFYKEITSTQQFYQFISEINDGNNNIYYEEFRKKVRLKKIKNKKEIYINDYYLYPYFFQKNKELESDLFNLEDETDLYYNCLDKEHETNYLLDSKAFLRINLILKNDIPQNLRKYEIKKENLKVTKNNLLDNLNDSNYDSNLTMSEIELDKFESIKSMFENIYGKVKTSINKIIPRKTSVNDINENKENISLNEQNKNNNKNKNKKDKIIYRHRNSLIKMIRENNNKKELMKYKEQIIELLKDYMGYVLSNQKMDILFSIDELAKLLKYRRIRREFSKILYQKKFEKHVEHELTEETFDLLYQSVFIAIINVNINNENKNEYKILRRIIKSLFYYFYERKKGIGKIYLYQKFLEKNEKFYFKKNLNFWKYYFQEEKIENEENEEYNYDESGLIVKIKNEMFLIEVDDDIINFF